MNRFAVTASKSMYRLRPDLHEPGRWAFGDQYGNIWLWDKDRFFTARGFAHISGRGWL